MKFCIQCGTQLEDSHKFCIKCGMKQEVSMGLQLETMVDGQRVVTDTIGLNTVSTSYKSNNPFESSDPIHDYVQKDWDCPIQSQRYDAPKAPEQNFGQYAETLTQKPGEPEQPSSQYRISFVNRKTDNDKK